MCAESRTNGKDSSQMRSHPTALPQYAAQSNVVLLKQSHGFQWNVVLMNMLRIAAMDKEKFGKGKILW